MTQTVFLAHWLGGAILIQSLMELYAYQKKKGSSGASTPKRAIRKNNLLKYNTNP